MTLLDVLKSARDSTRTWTHCVQHGSDYHPWRRDEPTADHLDSMHPHKMLLLRDHEKRLDELCALHAIERRKPPIPNLIDLLDELTEISSFPSMWSNEGLATSPVSPIDGNRKDHLFEIPPRWGGPYQVENAYIPDIKHVLLSVSKESNLLPKDGGKNIPRRCNAYCVINSWGRTFVSHSIQADLSPQWNFKVLVSKPTNHSGGGADNSVVYHMEQDLLSPKAWQMKNDLAPVLSFLNANLEVLMQFMPDDAIFEVAERVWHGVVEDLTSLVVPRRLRQEAKDNPCVILSGRKSIGKRSVFRSRESRLRSFLAIMDHYNDTFPSLRKLFGKVEATNRGVNLGENEGNGARTFASQLFKLIKLKVENRAAEKLQYNRREGKK
ncbi:hypothetical protein BJ742DRAFT_734583 [Cladochytrium replicatum]|nr:hypothetical protein BJ742DRAFT_734583 [Cladochytrium replicatum]